MKASASVIQTQRSISLIRVRKFVLKLDLFKTSIATFHIISLSLIFIPSFSRLQLCK